MATKPEPVLLARLVMKLAGKSPLASCTSFLSIGRSFRLSCATQMVVDGRPYLMLAGELHNSSASRASFMEPIWPKLAGLHLNTVVSTVSWELIEPIEGRFDFTSVDTQIRSAQEHGLHLVLIWFGTWKNASDSYAPMWVKKDQERFPPALVHGPGTFMGMRVSSLSSLGENTIAADAKAFATLMRHLREFDTRHTVIMMQVENETGLLGDSRDRSALAEAAWSKPVPSELMNYLSEHKSSLLPELAAIWEAHGFKTSGTWAEVFGTEPVWPERKPPGPASHPSDRFHSRRFRSAILA